MQQILQAERHRELQKELELVREKILNAFNDVHFEFTPQKATSLLLYMFREIYSNENIAQLDNDEIYTLYQLQELINEYEKMNNLQRTLSDSGTDAFHLQEEVAKYQKEVIELLNENSKLRDQLHNQ